MRAGGGRGALTSPMNGTPILTFAASGFRLADPLWLLALARSR
jgi:hypothetical protein